MHVENFRQFDLCRQFCAKCVQIVCKVDERNSAKYNAARREAHLRWKQGHRQCVGPSNLDAMGTPRVTPAHLAARS